MADDGSRAIPASPSPGWIAVLYALVGAAWIVLSDAVVSRILPDTPLAQTTKGLGFIVVTALALYILLTRGARRSRRIAAEVLEREERFRQLAENVHEVFWLLDAETREILYVSPAYEEIWGGSRDRLVGSPGLWLDAIHEDDRRKVLAALPGQAQGEYDLEYRVQGPDGAIRWIRDRAFPVRDETGRIRRIAGIAEDVTERKRTEGAFRQARDTLRSVIDSAPVPIITLDVEGNLLSWNDAAERTFLWTEDEVLGSPPPFVPPEEEKRFRELLDRALTAEPVSGVELVRRRKDGDEVQVVLSTARTYGPDGELIGIVAVLLDVTQRRTLEAQLRQSQKMEAVGRLAGGIAHDFNNLLTAIGGYAELVADATPEAAPERESVDEIRRAADQAARLTSQLLAFSRRQVRSRRPVDLGIVVDEMGGMLDRLLGEDVELTVQSGDGPWTVLADRGQIEQVVMNLAVNAREAMPEGGRLLLEIQAVDLDETYAESHPTTNPGSYVMLAVTDTGCGMDEQTVDRAFEPFFTTKDPNSGAGLGLATVYGIVSQSGGEIRLYSEPGEGTTVKVYLPREEQGGGTASARSGEVVVRGGHESVLVVEDNPAVRHLVTRILGTRGYRIREAETVEMAVARFEDGDVDLLLTDVVLPDGSGRSLAERLGDDVPVLYMSGYTDDAVVKRGVLERETAFIQKPFSANDLLRKVRAVLDAVPS